MSTTEVEKEPKTRRVQHEGRDAHGHWQKGYCPNPNGRYGKDRPSLTEAIVGLLQKQPEEVQALARATVENAKQGNAVALKQVWDRLDGTVTERSETLVKQAEASEMSREAILIAAEAIKRQDAEKEAATLDVEAGLPSEGTPDNRNDVGTE